MSDAVEKIESHRGTLESLAERDDLRVSEYAKVLLEAADSAGA